MSETTTTQNDWVEKLSNELELSTRQTYTLADFLKSNPFPQPPIPQSVRVDDLYALGSHRVPNQK